MYSSAVGVKTTPQAFAGGFAELKDRQLVFQLVRQLARAQFSLADRELTRRLWQEVADLDMDPERIIALLYGVADMGDTEAMEEIDRVYRDRAHPQPQRWQWLGFRRGQPGLGQPGVSAPRAQAAWHRNAPPAGPRAPRPGR
jgi:hypothetical protein